MTLQSIDGGMLKEMYISGYALLNQNRERVDALNVFPVPDGDTGTNMTQTMSAAVRDLNARQTVSASEVAAIAAKGALKGARGNSGVILSQIFRGFARALDGHDELDAPLLVAALKAGAETAYKAVMKPKEGTILTVARVMAEDGEAALARTTDLLTLFGAVIASGEAILKKTPEMLPVLKQAGVVDSGGKGLLIILSGFYSALSGVPYEPEDTEELHRSAPTEYVDDHSAIEEITFGYCTEFIVAHPKPEMREADVVRLRKRLEKIGDCVLVISDMSVVKVHVHTNEPGKALQMALELGELDAIKIDNMMEEHRERVQAAQAAKDPEKPFGMVAVSLGAGFSKIFDELGVDQIVEGGQTMNPSIDELVHAINATRAETVFVFPNNTNIILAARQAAELVERNVVVLPTKSVPMGVAAAITFQSGLSATENEQNMAEAAEQVHTAAITYAVRDTSFNELEIHEGDIMGMADNQIRVLGHSVDDVAVETVESMIGEEGGIITVYYGADVTEERAEALRDRMEARFVDWEIELQMGGQPLYYYLISVE